MGKKVKFKQMCEVCLQYFNRYDDIERKYCNNCKKKYFK